MTDATQVNIQESDMATVREVFQKALDAIVAATSLSKQVQQMQADMDRLRQTFDEVHSRNVELDRMLADTRRQRDDAEQSYAQAKSELSLVTNELAKTKDTLSIQGSSVDQLQANLSTARKQYDDAELEIMNLEDALAKANAKLKTIHDGMGVPFTPFAIAPKPIPQLEPAYAHAEPVLNPIVVDPPQSEPTPAYTDPHVETTLPRVYDGDDAFTWDKPVKFDTTMGKYYNE